MRIATLIALLVVVAAATAARAGSAPASGIRGNVTRGPLSPVCREGTPCIGPAGGVVLVALRDGRQVAKTITTGPGTFRFVLAPGVYIVRTLRRSFGNSFQGRPIRVWQGRFTIANFEIDTGIR